MTRFGYVLGIVTTAELFAALFVTVAIVQPRPRLIWNASASAPIGLYRVERDAHPSVDTLVRRPAARAGRPLASQRAAISPRACRCSSMSRHGRGNGFAAPAPWSASMRGPSPSRSSATAGAGRCRSGGDAARSSPASCCCSTHSVRDSMDGRYLGPLPASGLLGRAIPLLTRDAPGAPLRWRSSRARPAFHPANAKESGDVAHDL